ncbi:MAG: tetratricopeptide repeat protein [Planctomycetes bacterium]|nr:tetratricopeptide repeat protein [Planctomycetota bacterium]
MGNLTAQAAADDLAAARKLFLKGNYAEAAESYDLLAKKHPVDAALGNARCSMAVGELDKADKALAEAEAAHPKEVRLPAERAQIALERGDLAKADRQVSAALKLAPRDPQARWIAAELLRARGKIDEADKAYDSFVQLYNDTEFTDPDAVRYTALGLAQNARWRRSHGQFSDLVNDVYPLALKLDPDYWPAHLESGLLFMEKYNQPEAVKAFKAALKINPNAAEVHAALARLALQNYQLEEAKSAAEAALKINPNLLSAKLVLADIELANFEPALAEKLLVAALPLRPEDEGTLGRLAAARGALDGLDKTGPESRLGKLTAEVKKRNARPSDYYEALGESLDSLRRWPESAVYFRDAIAAVPQLTGAYGRLGIIELRLGQEKEARKTLDKAFEVDFGNVRVKNSLEVLDVLDGYATLETDHFIIRYDEKLDAVEARAIARQLEEVYPRLVKQFGFEPKGKTLFEIFNKAKNTTAHGWFSARTVGLPHIHTIGACVGRMVAMVSPSGMKQPFNWARVVQHEFIHVMNLQQTNYRIPHWFTEALAVYNEGYPRADEWNEMLLARVPAGKVFNLSTINQGFIRPETSENWQMAYCQAEMYAEYMLERFGDDALAKMLAGYADNLDTTATIRRAFGVELDDFEKGYIEYVKKVVAGLQTTGQQTPPAGGFPALLKAVADDPKNPDKLVALAQAYLDREAFPKAGQLARDALAVAPKHPGATYVLARLDLLVGNTDGVEAKLEGALDRKQPHAGLLKLLAGLKYRRGDNDGAAELYQLGRDRFGGDSSWTKLLTRVYLKSGDTAKLRPLLVVLAEHDGDDLTVRKKLMELAVAAKDDKEAARWSMEVLNIKARDLAARKTRAESLAALKQWPAAVVEYELAIETSPKQPDLRLGLIRALDGTGDKKKARAALTDFKKLWPTDPAVAELEKQIGP